MHLNPVARLKIYLLFLFVIGLTPCFAQPVLSRNVNINVDNQRLGEVLHLMEESGKFNFSYNSNLVPKDSLVSLHVANQPVKTALDKLLNNRFEYREAENFVILRYAPMQLAMSTDKFTTEDQWSTISGYVANEPDGRKLENASVYCRRPIASALTDANGHFEIRLKNESQPVMLTVSKENYRDTSVTFLSDVKVTDAKNAAGAFGDANFRYVSGDLSEVERTGMGRLFISSKQKIQSLNLGGIIARAPFQASLVPGLSTHGSLSGQVMNTVSLNLIGGYNAGVNGVEIGIFNLDKSDVRSFQLGILFNTVGGSVGGLQIGGAFNQVLKDVNGIQLALAFNIASGLNGVQVAAFNLADGKSEGIQAGIMNVAEKQFSGIQFGALFNYAQNLHGMQIGLINTSDYSSGVSIGLVNLVQHGYHKLVTNTNETTNLNVLYKTGTSWFYNIFLAGTNLNKNNKQYAYGLGYGNELPIFKFLALNSELTARYLNQGTSHYKNFLYRLDEGFNVKLGQSLSIMSGPSLNVYYTDQPVQIKGYDFVADNAHHHVFDKDSHYSWWIGWTASITL